MKSSNSKTKKEIIKSGPYKGWTKEAYDSFRDYQIKYYKEHYRTFSVKFNRENDKEVIDFLESKENIAAWVREAVKKELSSKDNKK